MKNNKGFTLVEILVTVGILSLVTGIAIFSVNSLFDSSKDSYYKSVEQTLLLAGDEFFNDNKNEKPSIGFSKISLDYLVKNEYTNIIKDKNGNPCDGDVYIYKKDNNYGYQPCLKCSDYETDNDYCKGNLQGEIIINAVTKENKKYNPYLSYANSEYVESEYVKFTFSMKNQNPTFKVKDLNTSKYLNLTNNSITIKTNGSFRVEAYNENNIVIGSRNFNVKFDNQRPTFDLKNNNNIFVLENDETTYLYRNQIINLKDDNGIKSVSYKLDGKNTNITDTLTIEQSLKSGKYSLEINVKDSSNKVESKTYIIEVKFNVMMLYVDPDGRNVNLGNILVSKNGTYNNLVEKDANGDEITYYLDASYTKKITSTTKENIGHYHIIFGKSKYIKIDKPTNSMCDNKIYNGLEQTITKDTTSLGYTFIKNKYTNAGNYTVEAKLDPDYKWKDNTFDNVEISCEIAKKKIEVYTGEETWTYDGLDHSNSLCYSNDLVNKEVITCELKVKVKYVKDSQYNVISSIKTYKDSSKKIETTSNYETVKYIHGMLTINKRDVTYRSGSAEKYYDGTPLKKETATIIDGSLPDNHKAEFSNFSEVTDHEDNKKNTVPNKFKVKIYIKGTTTEVTENFNINYDYGDLTIKPRIIIQLPTSKTYCNSLTYNGTKQTLAKGTGVTFENNQKTNAGDYKVTVKLDGTHIWPNKDLSDKTITCSINKKSATIKTSSGSWEYDGKAHSKKGDSDCSITGLVDSEKFSCTITKTVTNVDDNCKNAPASYDIKRGSNSTLSNYEITTNYGNLTITPKPISISGGGGGKIAGDGGEQTCKIDAGKIEGTITSSISGPGYFHQNRFQCNSSKCAGESVIFSKSGTSSGTITATLTVTPKSSNYKGGSVTCTFQIVKKARLECVDVTYDKKSHTLCTCSDCKITSGTSITQTNAGTYTYEAKANSDAVFALYGATETKNVAKINKAKVNVSVGNCTKEYTGSNITCSPSCRVTTSNTTTCSVSVSKKDIGTYDLDSVTLGDENNYEVGEVSKGSFKIQDTTNPTCMASISSDGIVTVKGSDLTTTTCVASSNCQYKINASGTFTYTVKDTSGNKGTCQITASRKKQYGYNECSTGKSCYAAGQNYVCSSGTKDTNFCGSSNPCKSSGKNASSSDPSEKETCTLKFLGLCLSTKKETYCSSGTLIDGKCYSCSSGTLSDKKCYTCSSATAVNKVNASICGCETWKTSEEWSDSNSFDGKTKKATGNERWYYS